MLYESNVKVMFVNEVHIAYLLMVRCIHETNQLYIMLQKPWRREPWPMEASECHFLIGMCHIELKGYHEAKDAFTSAVKINPNYAQV